MASLCSKWNSDNSSESNIDSSVVSWERNECSLIDGAMFCVRDPLCRSFFHHASLKKCLGSQSYKRGLPASHATQKGGEYFTQSLDCDEGYIYNQSLGVCYKYHAEHRTYTKAMAVSETESAKLLIIMNEAEFKHFSNIKGINTL
ncbi:hypothetical protein ACJMK2_000963 [Sinanodonta woodiana]|uniref:Uncharacterized protein n=2 Tax=Sinanodonta woodiana TaxID=1069815 RepID=A0ABD3XUA0_SINWO